MMIQKVIKVGNSAAVTLPPDFLKSSKIKIGDQVYVGIDESAEAIVVSSREKPFRGVSADIASWTDKFIKKNRKALEELSNI